MNCLVFAIFLSALTTLSFGQRAQRIMLAIHTDLIKSDNDGFLEKVQGGVEGSFYFSRKFAPTAGVEWWTDDRVVFIPGVRICPIDEAFIRIRGLIGHDVSIGGGFAKPLSDHLRIEAMGDLYFEGHIAIRAGIAYGLGPRP